jgi:putative oxidoreductase
VAYNHPAMSTLSTILAVILGIAFLVAGIPKLTGQPRMVDNFQRWGYARSALVATGSVEVLASAMMLIGIAVPALAITGALLVICLMVGALWTHQRAKDPVAELGPAAMLLALAVALLVSLLP